MPSKAVAALLGVSKSHLHEQAKTAGIENRCGGVRVWFRRDVDTVRPYVQKRKRFEDAGRAAKLGMKGWIK